ncbi:uncharacterized protein KZ484_018323 isoform 2-T2 [Pholidichthys leucotaenia]
MEHNAIQWLGSPSCQRGSYAFYKSVSSRVQPDGPVQVWKLGEFYFIRCGPQDPVCIAEVTLLWEDQVQHLQLASARLYFLPEDTPSGRTREHGEDEVLAVSRKMVVRVEDLMRWVCAEPTGWSKSPKLPCGTNGLHRPPHIGDVPVSTLEKSSELLKDKTENGLAEHQGVKVLSYPQYCRFRSLQRRIQDSARDPGLQDPHLLALGGVKVPPSTRVMYCRDTFNHPTLESSASFSWQFRCPSVSLRGRPRKRRGRDSRDSPTSSQSESWIEKMKENVMGSVEDGCEGEWLPHPEEQLFLDQLYAFMERHGSPIHKVPNLGFKKIDLFLMYNVVKRLGGYNKVTAERLWKVVYNELGGCPSSTSAATCTRRHYERLVLPYEEHLRTGEIEFKVPQIPVPLKPRKIRGRKPLPRGRKPGPKPRERKIIADPVAAAASLPPPTVVNGMVVVKRRRGRPPGTRNRSTLLALQQAKARAAAEGEEERQSTLLPPRSQGGPMAISTHRHIQPAISTINMPLSPELTPVSAPFLPFQPKLKEVKVERGESVPPTLPPAGMILTHLPHHHYVGGSLSGFSPIKGVCPLDMLRNRLSLQRPPESPALTPQDPAQHRPTVYTLQPKNGSPDTPLPSGEQLQLHPLQQHHNQCSGCNGDEGDQRAASRDGRSRPPLPPLRLLPLNLDCSVHVSQLMRARHLDQTHLQTFTRRLSEALSQDFTPSPTAPPEQSLPLNLSKRFTVKRPSAEGPEPSRATVNGNTEQLASKRPRPGFTEQSEDLTPASRTSSGGNARTVQVTEVRNQEEPADLSSPSRIRAFLLGLPPFQVKLEEDLNLMKFGRFLPSGSQNGEGPQREVKLDEEKEKVYLPKLEPEERAPTVCPAPAELKRESDSDTHCF